MGNSAISFADRGYFLLIAEILGSHQEILAAGQSAVPDAPKSR
jgi:hypothetical protein